MIHKTPGMVLKAWCIMLNTSGFCMALLTYPALPVSNGEERCAECHSYLVAQRDEGVLESVVSDARLPLAILHTVGDDGIDGCIEA